MAENQPINQPHGVDVEVNDIPLVTWTARLSVYLLAQGALVLLTYAYHGFATDPASLPLGFRLDPLHAGLRLAWGIAGTYIGFFRPRYATLFILAFAACFTVLAVLGSFTPYHLGMRLSPYINLFHWLIIGPLWAIGLYGLWRERG